MIPLLLPVALMQGAGNFALHDGDRVLFYGDSITDNQFYPQYVETYVVTRFPNMRVTFMNYGWSGDKVSGGGGGDIATRLERDVFAQQPTVVTIFLGMNDGLYRPWEDSTFRTFKLGYEHILDELRANGNPRVTLIKPSPFDDVTLAPNFPGGYNAVLQRFGTYIGNLGPKVGATVADFNRPLVDLLTKAKATDPDGARKLIQDRVHPSPAAHIVMGDALLQAWDAPSLVSSVHVDASSGLSLTDNAAIREMRVRRDSISWKALEGSLPVYFDKSAPGVALVLKCTDVFDNVDDEPLRVSNLRSGTYRLTIDGQDQGRFTSSQLDGAINLAELNTPMMKQSAGVAVWTSRRQFVRQLMWRNILVGMEGLGLLQRDPALKALEELESDIIDHQRQAAKPVWHTFKLEKVR